MQEEQLEWETRGLSTSKDRKGWMEKENKILGTERFENIDTLYINKTFFTLYLMANASLTEWSVSIDN